ncbi:hypothetical protein OS493_017843 [Desmophyllum pertusum]|uniref:Uncharacterized protein n=1 Tax=Desmophyllum pertusum TaxID=174260 RepID=A0A9W9YZV8_9CNID|nr:hypothetical protein OS493_017843 [Desmophyllum pertusum]
MCKGDRAKCKSSTAARQKQEQDKTPHPPVFDGTDKTVPKDLKDNSVIDHIEDINREAGEEDALFETDIKLTPHDHNRVETSLTGNAEGAEVKVESIQGQKRKAIRSRRKIWPSRIVPVEMTPATSKRNFL